jgi:hypothetical protein
VAQPILRGVEVQAKALRNGQVLPYHDLIDREIVEEALKEENLKFRVRVYTPLITLWTFMTQVLDNDHSCRKAVRSLDDAVLGLAQPTAPLLLHTGCFVPLFRVAGLVQEPDSVWALVLSGNQLLETVAQAILSPPKLTEEFLQRAGSYTRIQRHWLDALLGEIRELTPHVDTQVCSRNFPTEAIVEVIQELDEFRLQTPHLVDIHVLSSRSPWQDTASPRNDINARST